jgi:hypothetical protein
MKTFYEAIIGQGGFAGQVFDVTQGPTTTETPDIIDVLLPTGNATLTGNAPVNIISTGLLGGTARTLFITGMEQPGRFFFLSVRNTDLASGALTISPTTSINGSATMVLSAPADYLYVHESGGVWRAYQQSTAEAGEAYVFRATFAAIKWSNGVVNKITILRTGVAGAGQIGPHLLSLASSYTVQVFRDSDNQKVDVGVIVDPVTGNITMTKTGLGTDFAGRVIVMGS